MHIPDGFLDAKTAGVAGVIAAAAVGTSLYQTSRSLPRRKVPLMGLAAAFIFAAQMLNFPVAGGTSGHLVGGVLASVLLGPSAAVLVLTSVLVTQCFLFSDGGLTALGANILNMGVISSVGGYYLYRLVFRALAPRAAEEGGASIASQRARLAAIAFSAWVTTVLAAMMCAGELTMSGSVAWNVAFPAMTFVHMLIGVGEAVLTCLVVVAIAQSRPDLLTDTPTSSGDPRRFREFLIYGFLIACGLALFISPFASKWPDGLDRVAEKLHFSEREVKTPMLHSPMTDYKMPMIHNEAIATSIAGVVGVLIVFGLALLLARVLVKGSATAHVESTLT